MAWSSHLTGFLHPIRLPCGSHPLLAPHCAQHSHRPLPALAQCCLCPAYFPSLPLLLHSIALAHTCSCGTPDPNPFTFCLAAHPAPYRR